MASSGSVFSETLLEITNTKLEELSKRRKHFEDQKTALLEVIAVEKDPVKRLVQLSNGVKGCFSIKTDSSGKVTRHATKHLVLEAQLQNLDRFLAQARHDPSVSAKLLESWEGSLLRSLEVQSLKFRYASLYGQLVTEWLSGEGSGSKPTAEDVDMGGAFEDVGNAAKLEARMSWEKSVFEAANVDVDALKAYLDQLFGTHDKQKKGVKKALAKFREQVTAFEAQISRPNQFAIHSLTWTINGLLQSGLLSDEKREVLKDFKSNQVILNEIADVLNMRLAAIDSWSWGSGVQVEQQRQINGRYNITMHEDLLQAIFLQYLGVKWSVFLKGALKQFRKEEDAWVPLRKDIPAAEKRRLGYYLGPLRSKGSAQRVRESVHQKSYFVAQLLDGEQQDIENVDGQEEAEYEAFASVSPAKRRAVAYASQAPMPMQQAPRPVARKSAPTPYGAKSREAFFDMEAEMDDESDNEESDDDTDVGTVSRNPMEMKQRLLHFLSAEMAINTRLYGEMSAFHSVFESWNPLLPHETVRTILSFLGVSQSWLGFFTKFLEAPLRFVDDDESTPARKRQRGTPAAHVLSDVFGEITLFCLDFSVNQSTSGNLLYRLRDDVWFWSVDHSVCVKAWKAVAEFGKATGTTINERKSGSVRIGRDPSANLAIDKSLPAGDIRWGFLQLSPRSGRFEIDQKMVDHHINELRSQLQGKQKSVFSFVQAWNTYAATFFTSNFGLPANCFGRDHVDQMLKTHERIQREIFSSTTGSKEGSRDASVVDHLKTLLRERFAIEDVPDGYFFFPAELGGLDLQSPFISLLQIRDAIIESPGDLLDKLEESEQDSYAKALTNFRNGTTKKQRNRLPEPNWEPSSEAERDNFISFDEFVRYREEFNFGDSKQVQHVLKELMERPAEQGIDGDNTVISALSELGGQANLRGIMAYWGGMEAYWKWVAMMYGPEIIERFGGMNVVDPGLLPMGMVSLFRDKRVKWQG